MTMTPVTQADSLTSWPIARFNRACYALALVWIGAALVLSLRWSPNEFPDQEAPELHDFSQFYMGGLIARHKAWDQLYPIPKPGSLNSPGAWEYSDTRPGYRAMADEAGVPEKASRYIQPPPFALLLEPVAMFKYRTAKKVWKLLMVFCAWGVAVMAGRSYELAAGRRSALAGVIALGVAISPLTLGTLQLMNVSPFIALMAGIAALGLASGRAESGAVAMVIGAAAKYATVPLLPLYVAMRKWHAVFTLAMTSAALLAISIGIMGTGPFKVFIHEMLPTFGRTYTAFYNHSFTALLTQCVTGDMRIPLSTGWMIGARAVQWGAFFALLGILFGRKAEFWREPVQVMAASASLLCWFLIFSPILWDHYFFYLVPLWGWLAWEARRSIPRAVVVGLVILFQSLPEAIKERPLPGGFTLHGERVNMLGPHECFMLLTAVGIGCLAVARMLTPFARPTEEGPAKTAFTFTTAQFNQTCAALAGAWLLIAVPASLRLRSLGEGDFPQFYMGGVMARLHAWDSLYPIPNPVSNNNAGMETDSTMRPRYAAEAEKRGVGDRLRFIQPPPVALLLLPLGYLGYHRAFELWTLMLVGSGWLVAALAGKVFARLNRRESKIAGVVVLLVACSPLMLHAIRVANMTVLVALLTGWAIMGLLPGRLPNNISGGSARVKGAGVDASLSTLPEMLSAVSIVLGTATKYVTLALLPLAVVMRRWKLLSLTALVGLLFLAASFVMMKAEPFRVYFRQIAPTLTRTHHIESNQSIPAFLGRLAHRDTLSTGPRLAVLAVEGSLLATLLWLLVSKPRAVWDAPEHVFAAAMALLTFLLVFSPIFWEHYPVYLCPLWGWLIWESCRSRAMAVGTFISIALTYVPVTAWFDLREPFNTHILPSALIMLGLAMWRLSKATVGPGELDRVVAVNGK